MPQSLSQVYVHLIFSTKERRPLLPVAEKGTLHAYIAGILSNIGCHAVEINSIPDHIHILYNLARTKTMAQVVEAVKSSSSHWIKNQGKVWHGWQGGYSSFSVSESVLETVSSYIKNQEEHHKKHSFNEELIILLRKHRTKYDEQYLWD